MPIAAGPISNAAAAAALAHHRSSTSSAMSAMRWRADGGSW
jgi:hypothetical protein